MLTKPGIGQPEQGDAEDQDGATAVAEPAGWEARRPGEVELV